MDANETRLNELYRTPSRRWALNGHELTCGSTIEVNIQGHWIRIVIEHDGKDYFALPSTVRLHAGLYARFLGEYTD